MDIVSDPLRLFYCFAYDLSLFSQFQGYYVSFFIGKANCTDAWYIIVKAAEARQEYVDIESAPSSRRDEYQPIAQFDYTYQQRGVREGVGEGPTYAEVAAGATSQQNAGGNASTDAPPSYSAIVKGGISFTFAH